MTVTFFIEGGPRIGMGHAERCRVLAQEAVARGHDLAVMLRGPRSLVTERNWPDRRDECYLPEDHDNDAILDTALNFAANQTVSIAVVDGYGFLAANLPGRLREQGWTVLAMVDVAKDVSLTNADFILNAGQTEPDNQRMSADKKLLSGPRYALIPSEGLAGPLDAHQDAALRILVTFGGSDPTQASLPAVSFVDNYCPEGAELNIVIGPHFPDTSAPHSERHRVICHRSPASLGPLLRGADILITASGSTCFQGCRTGVPMIAVVVADNQTALSSMLENAGAAIVLPRARLDHRLPGPTEDRIRKVFNSPRVRQEMGAAAAALVDGNGAARVADQIGL